MKELSLGFTTKIVTQKTVSKQTKEVDKLTPVRIEMNNTGVYVGVKEIPGEVIKIADEIPKAIDTLIQNKLLELIEDPTERAKRLAK